MTDELKVTQSSPQFSDDIEYRLPNGLILSLDDYRNSPDGKALHGGITKATDNSPDPDDYQYFASMVVIMGGTVYNDTVRAVPGKVFAEKCGIRFCINTYDAEVINGTFNEAKVPIPFTLSFSNGDTWNLQIFADLVPEVCFINGTQKLPPYEEGDGCTFQVCGGSVLSMGNTLGSMFDGYGILSAGIRIYWSSNTVQNWAKAGTFEGLQRSFHQLADVVTSHIRNGESLDMEGNITDGGSVTGAVLVNQSYLEVQWPWLVLPVSLMALTAVFSVSTTILTRNDHIWKSSSVALLLHGLEPDVDNVLRPRTTLSEMDDIANMTKIYLEVRYNGSIAFTSA